MTDSSSFKTPFGSQHISRSQTLPKPSRQQVLPNFLLMPGKLNWKKSLLIKSKILGPCFNTLTDYHMNSRQNKEKSPQQSQMQLS